MYLVSLMVEDINRNVGNEIVSNVGNVVEIKEYGQSLPVFHLCWESVLISISLMELYFLSLTV